MTKKRRRKMSKAKLDDFRFIDVTDPVRIEDWVDALRARALKILSDYRRGLRNRWDRADYEISVKGGAHKLTVLQKGLRLVWLVDEGSVGAGEVQFDPDTTAWQEFGVGLAPEYRRRGIYTTVLGAIKKHLGAKVWSDRVLSPAARALWKKIGSYDAQRERFHNPPRRRVALSDAILLREALNHLGTRP